MARKQLRKKLLMNWNFCSLQRGNFCAVVVYGNHFVSDFRETSRRNQSHISRSNHCNAHVDPFTLYFVLRCFDKVVCFGTFKLSHVSELNELSSPVRSSVPEQLFMYFYSTPACRTSGRSWTENGWPLLPTTRPHSKCGDAAKATEASQFCREMDELRNGLFRLANFREGANRTTT
jgi:hypothetical protein